MLMQIQVYKLCLTTSVRGEFLLNIIHSWISWSWVYRGITRARRVRNSFTRIYFDEVSYLENRLRRYNIPDII